MYHKKTGFTLVEILVASTIGAFISLVAIGTLKTVIRGNEMAERNMNAAAEVRFAANMIMRDLVNFYRTENYEDTVFYGSFDRFTDFQASYIIFYTLNKAKARIYEPECDIYEVEYYLEQAEDDSLSLMRRVWPNPNEVFDPGGIVTVIAENIVYFDITYYYDNDTYDEWTPEMETWPDLVEVSIITTPIGLGNEISETLIVNLIKSVGEESYTVQ
jgi:type II secretion system protein J